MNRGLTIAVSIILGLGALIVISAMFTVHQTQQALVLQFGDPRKVITEPGLNFKVPFLQQAVFMERRILPFDADAQEIVAGDNRRLVVDAFARWRITDPLKFYQTVREEGTARDRIGTLMDASVREILGKQGSDDIVSGQRGELMTEIANEVTRKAESLGIEIVDVRLRRVDLPLANSQSIFERMKAEREREAREERAEGNEDGQTIRAKADRDVTIIRADAEKQADILRGEGDRERNRILAEAYGQDPEFFEFYRSMLAYQRALGGNSTSMLLDPKSDFFKFFGDIEGRQ